MEENYVHKCSESNKDKNEIDMKSSFFQYTYSELVALFLENNLVLAGANVLYNQHYKKKQAHNQKKKLAQKTQNFLNDFISFDLPEIDHIQESSDKTVKFLIKLNDGLKVETVLIPFNQKYSICLSSQVGCAMNCSFCYTGTQGLKRHLKTEEIVGQFMLVQQWLTEHRPSEDRILNIVFMGQGEPLHNFDSVKNACMIFLANNGLCLAAAKITISTSGYIPGLIRWKDEMPDVNIALSLHSPFSSKRNELIPLNQKYPLEEVLTLVDKIPHGKNRFVTYEYLLVKDFNDQEEDAHATGRLLQGKNAYINLIPFNPYPGAKYQKPTQQVVENFKSILETYHLPTLIRKTKGDEILAACGQLNTITNSFS